jgi:hypothetical protein
MVDISDKVNQIATMVENLFSQCAKYFESRKLKGAEDWQDSSVISFDLLDKFLTKICCEKKIVLMIDEVDKTSNNLVFLRFIGMLMDKYLKRNGKKKFLDCLCV